MKHVNGVHYWILSLLGTLQLLQQLCLAANVTDIRLANPSSNGRSGRLEIQINGDNVWGVVCDDNWNNNVFNAIVACRHLGFTNGGTAVLDDSYGRGTPFLLDDTDCDAGMTSLAQCRSAQQHNCGPADSVVALECNADTGQTVTTFQPPATTTKATGTLKDNCNDPNIDPTVRLSGDLTVNGTGFVEVKNPATGEWGFVCDDGWDALAAKVVCAQLCYPTNYTAQPGIPAEYLQLPTSPKIILDDVLCLGTENTLQDCQHNQFATTNDCSTQNAEFAGVQCIGFEPPQPPKPVLECGGGLLKTSFHRSRDRDLEEKHLTVLADPNCADVTKSTTPEFVSITIPVDKCGTNLSRNSTHIIYENNIKYAATSQEGAITRVNTYRVEVLCALPVDKSVTQRVQPVTETITEEDDGVITAEMVMFSSDSFQTQVTENPMRIPLGQYLNLAVAMEDYDERLKLVVTECVSTPTGVTSNARLTKDLFIDKCAVEKTLSFYPLSNSEFAFRFQPFKFINYPLLYVQCKAIVCLAADTTAECDRTCNNTKPATSGRKKRSVSHRQMVESPAIIIYDPLDSTDDNDNQVVINVENSDTTVLPPATTPRPGVATTQPATTTTTRSTATQPQTRPATSSSSDSDTSSPHIIPQSTMSGFSVKGNKSSTILPMTEFIFIVLVSILILF